MKKKIKNASLIFFAALAFGRTGARSAHAAESTRNPYLVIHFNNWKIAEIEAQEESINLTNEEINLTRFEELARVGALPSQDLEQQKLKTDTIRYRYEALLAKAVEKRELYNVNRIRFENGLQVPFCSEGD